MLKRILCFLLAAFMVLLPGGPAWADAKKAQIIPICVVLAKGQHAWSIAEGGSLVTEDEATFNKRAGKVIYVHDAKAPHDSVLKLPSKFHHLRCPGDTRKTLPKPGGSSGTGSSGQTGTGSSAQSGSGSSGQSGSGSSSSAQNQRDIDRIFNPGRTLTWIDQLAQNMVIAGAFVSGMTGETLRHPQGVAGGMPGGKNIGGPNLPILQLVVGTAMVALAVVTTVGMFEQKLLEATKKKVPAIFPEGSIDKQVADDLLKLYGDELPNALHQLKTVLPYDIAQKFTKGYGHVFEGHHLFEREMMTKLGVGGADKAPVVILLKDQHKKMTAALAAEKATKPQPISMADLWAVYEKVYGGTPHYLDAIRHYFRDVL